MEFIIPRDTIFHIFYINKNSVGIKLWNIFIGKCLSAFERLFWLVVRKRTLSPIEIVISYGKGFFLTFCNFCFPVEESRLSIELNILITFAKPQLPFVLLMETFRGLLWNYVRFLTKTYWMRRLCVYVTYLSWRWF